MVMVSAADQVESDVSTLVTTFPFPMKRKFGIPWYGVSEENVLVMAAVTFDFCIFTKWTEPTKSLEGVRLNCSEPGEVVFAKTWQTPFVPEFSVPRFVPQSETVTEPAEIVAYALITYFAESDIGTSCQSVAVEPAACTASHPVMLQFEPTVHPDDEPKSPLTSISSPRVPRSALEVSRTQRRIPAFEMTTPYRPTPWYSKALLNVEWVAST